MAQLKPTKGAKSYFARFVAQNIVRVKLATKAEVQVAYAIGVAKPVSAMVDTFGIGDERGALTNHYSIAAGSGVAMSRWRLHRFAIG